MNNKIYQLNQPATPCYYYDLDLLRKTLSIARRESERYGFEVHYALKANINPVILSMIKDYGFGADCVSGGEIEKAIQTGFPADSVVFAGVGKSDVEIVKALKNDIYCFNCESIPEMEVMNDIALRMGKKANVALRINPNVNAKTHDYITTGIEDNKFGINMRELYKVVELLTRWEYMNLIGVHFHIGSQITEMGVFKSLTNRVNEILQWFYNQNITIKDINLGGGLGIDYDQPEMNPVPDFKSYFRIFNELLERKKGQRIHFELGRSLVGQCGTLLTKVLYVKEGMKTNFVIVDAGMTELLRPALYRAYHKIENLTSSTGRQKYDVVGPICESADYFGKAIELPVTKRDDLIAIRSVGAYGEVMASAYNARGKVASVFSNQITNTKTFEKAAHKI